MQLQQAIIPVAGMGTRFLPWTKVVPKELLPIGNKPAIALIVDECMSAGIREIAFVISKGKESIPRYFLPDAVFETEIARRGKSEGIAELLKYHEVQFQTFYQEHIDGDGHAIIQAKDWVHANHIAILYGDDILDHQPSALVQMVEFWEAIPQAAQEKSSMLCLTHVKDEDVSKYGIVSLDEAASTPTLKKISALVEKPSLSDAPSRFGIIGKYIVTREVLSKLDATATAGTTEVRLIDGLIEVLASQHLFGCLPAGERFDLGTPEGYCEAESRLCLRNSI